MHLHVFKVVSWLATLAWTRHCEGKLTNSYLNFHFYSNNMCQ